jgi:hypothetical protein
MMRIDERMLFIAEIPETLKHVLSKGKSVPVMNRQMPVFAGSDLVAVIKAPPAEPEKPKRDYTKPPTLDLDID